MKNVIDILEAIINEVSIGRLVSAANNVKDERLKKAEDSQRPGSDPSKRAEALKRAGHALDIVTGAHDLKPSTMKASANKVKDAARKSMSGRKMEKEFSMDTDKTARYQSAKRLSKIGESSITEAVINEVSVNLWSRAAASSKEKREKELSKAQDRKVYNDADRAQKNKDVAKALERNERAAQVKELADNLGGSLKPESMKSATEVRKAARQERRAEVNRFSNLPLSKIDDPDSPDKKRIRTSNVLASPLHGKVLNNDQYVKETMDLIEEVISFADSLFEVETSDATMIEPSSNKLKKTKKDKNGDRKEVVSVADELFPREGNAQEQKKQKVLDIINGMIEGTNTLDDLLQAVQKNKLVK